MSKLDCGDNSCMFAEKKGGMRTNGGCRCFENAGYNRSAIASAYKLLPEVQDLRAQLAKAEAERDELKALHELSCKYVLPGECDTSDAYRKILRDAQRERDEFKAMHDEECRLNGMGSEREAKLMAQVVAMNAALTYVVENSPSIKGSNEICLWCDMGGAGYSTKGDGHHDDIRKICPVLRCQEAQSPSIALDAVRGAQKALKGGIAGGCIFWLEDALAKLDEVFGRNNVGE